MTHAIYISEVPQLCHVLVAFMMVIL